MINLVWNDTNKPREPPRAKGFHEICEGSQANTPKKNLKKRNGGCGSWRASSVNINFMQLTIVCIMSLYSSSESGGWFKIVTCKLLSHSKHLIKKS